MLDAEFKLTAAPDRTDLTDLRTKGVQIIRNFFPDAFKRDLGRRAGEIVALRDAGKLTTYDQDSRGLPNDWFRPLVCDKNLLQLVAGVIGPNICTVGHRILAKDKHFKFPVHVHQDWPYGSGNTGKVTAFIPLTRMNAENGGLIFLEESHLYGPVARGPIDVSRFPPMNELCPDVDVGDIILCDFLTWHYSHRSSNQAERILFQFNYQPADDASSNDVVAGVRSHDKLLLSRYDAMEYPQSEINGRTARRLLDEGDADRAARYARGLFVDDDQHSSAALLLAEILSANGDPTALNYIEAARQSLRSQAARLAVLDRRYGLESTDLFSSAAPPTDNDHPPIWRPLDISWRSVIDGVADSDGPAAALKTSHLPYGYGALSSPINISSLTTIKVKARALTGKVGFCLIEPDNGPLVSAQHPITPDMGDITVMITANPEHPNLELVVRNFDDPGVVGEVLVQSVEIMDHWPESAPTGRSRRQEARR